VEEGDGVFVSVDTKQVAAHFVQQTAQVPVESEEDVAGHYLTKKIVDSLQRFNCGDQAEEVNEGEGQDLPRLPENRDDYQLINF
jgi:hypothetical protein